ncbi:MAG TPA: 3-keto-5-aminohexanoate cleavage protein [Chloroflexota bacterium]|jgi:uncharacterized protein (DUF849 family)
MYFTDDSLLPENQDPLIITAAPYGPMWLPGDDPHLPVTWEEQVQAAVDCYNAGATILHIHVRDPESGKISKNFKQYGEQIGRLRAAVPKMILQVGGSISFAPEGDEMAHWQTYDTRHMLAELDPKPDQITVAIGSGLYDPTPLMTLEDVEGTHLASPKAMWQMANMVADATPEFYIEHLKRLRQHEIQPYFALAHVHNLQIVERLVRQGVYMGPMNGFFSMIGGGVAGTNPFDFMELIRRTPQGSVWTYQTMMRHTWPLVSLCTTLGQHTRVGIEENFWGALKGERLTTVRMVEKNVRMARELGREIATAEEARRILKLGTWYNSVEETLFNLGLPPNRAEGQQGFLTYDTDGRLPTAPADDTVDPRLVL